MPESSAHSSKQLHPFRRYAVWALLAVLAPVIGLILFEQIGFYKVPSSSMEPTLYPDDFIFAQKASAYARGDIVVTHDPDNRGEFFVKRIVGVGGDTISVSGGAVFLNGRYASEPYRHSPIDYLMKPYTIPEGELFLLGDNSNWSIDSHNWGLEETRDGTVIKEGRPRGIPLDRVVGKVKYIYLPKKRRGPIASYPLRAIAPRR